MEAEKRLIPPGARFHESFRITDEQENRTGKPLPELREMLKKYDSFLHDESMEKQGDSLLL